MRSYRFRPLLAAVLVAGCSATAPDGKRTAFSGGGGEDGLALVRLGDRALAQGDAAAAVTFYLQAADLDARALAPLLRAADVALANGDTAAAIAAYRAAVQRDRRSAAARVGLATALLRAGAPQDAEAVLGAEPAIVGSEAERRRARRLLGVALDQQGRHDQAIAVYEQALAEFRDDLDLRSNLALSLCLAGRCEEGVSQSTTVAADPRARTAHLANHVLVLALAGRDPLRDGSVLLVLDRADIATLQDRARGVLAIADPQLRARMLQFAEVRPSPR